MKKKITHTCNDCYSVFSNEELLRKHACKNAIDICNEEEENYEDEESSDDDSSEYFEVADDEVPTKIQEKLYNWEMESRKDANNIVNAKIIEEKMILRKEIEKLEDVIERKDNEINALIKSNIDNAQKIKELHQEIEYRDNIIDEFNLENILAENADVNNISENLNNFGSEKCHRIDNAVLKKCLLAGKSGCSLLFKYLHFHPKHPDNYNVKINGDQILIFDDDMWQEISEDRLCSLHIAICIKFYGKYLKMKNDYSDDEIAKYREMTMRDTKFETDIRKLLVRTIKNNSANAI